MVDACEVLVIGAGPAGLAAATAAECGAQVTVLDVQPRAGGQVWRHDLAHRATRAARRAVHGLRNTRQFFGVRVVDVDPVARSLLIESVDGARELQWQKLVLATGAQELFLPFPGWTLPGVSGAGGLQALAKQGWPIEGKRVVIAGSGPLLLAAAASLRTHGARVIAVVEAATRQNVHTFARGLWRWPAKLAQAVQLGARLIGVPIHYGAVARSARGGTQLRSVVISRNGADLELDCDFLGVGFGLVPEVALARLLGCVMTDALHPAVQIDPLQQTSIAGVFAAGECCGIGGMDKARIEGAIAGHTAVGDETAARALFAARTHAQRFAEALARTYAPGPSAHALADGTTVVCRCEDVSLGVLRGFPDARAAKLETRCGMGPCQGRICGAALAELFGWSWHGHPRQPLFPARLASLAVESLASRSCT